MCHIVKRKGRFRIKYASGKKSKTMTKAKARKVLGAIHASRGR